MKQYTSLPKSGNGRKIWLALSPDIIELHYNPNCYGKGRLKGWGTWACELRGDRLFWTGIDKYGIYIEQMSAPFDRIYIKLKNDSEGK